MKTSTSDTPQPTRSVATIFVLALFLALPLRADHCHTGHAAPEPAPTEGLGSVEIPDVELVDQNGETVHFYSDLVQGRVVAINFVFTTCTTICPPMGANFAKLQKLLGKDGTEVELISVSVDPVVDTPPRLQAWARKFGRKDGWTLLTGSKTDVDRLLKTLQVFTPDKTDHSPIVLLGDDTRGRWTRTYGLTPPTKLAEMLGEMTATDHAASHAVQEGR